MKQGKYAAPVRRRRRRNTLKPMLIAMAVVLLLGCVTGGTLAWLTSTTDAVVNTFTTSDINITLAESENLDFKMIPGWTITKDPKVTVVDGSEDCWLFVKIEESASLDKYISYTVDAGWAPLKNGETVIENVYCRKVLATATTKAFDVIGYMDPTTNEFTANKVLVNGSVTKTDMEALKATNAVQPTLTFTAYASQLYKSAGVEFSAADAWANVNPTTTP